MTQGPPPGYGPRPGYGPPPPGSRPPGYSPPGYPPPGPPPPGYGRPGPGYGPPPPGYGPPPGNRPPGYPPAGPQRGYPPPTGRPPVPPQGPGRPQPGPPQAPLPDQGPRPTPEQPPAPAPRDTHDDVDEDLAPRSGKIGDFLEGQGQYGLHAGWRILMIRYPADESFIDAGLTIPDGYASAIVGGMFTNKSGGPIQAPPASGLCLLDSQGGVHAPAAAVLDSHPGFREGEVFDEETIAGHVFYLIHKELDVQGIQWQSGGDVLTWLR